MSLHLNQLPPLSLYIHIPWCEKKCPYCDFNSHENFHIDFEQQYIECLLEDFHNDLEWAQGRRLQSIFIGGGTPSIFSAQSIQYLLQKISTSIEFDDNIEITIEANPASSQGEYFSQLKESFVNRVSLGIQSFQPKHLSALGRLHTREDAISAISKLSSLFENYNLDLMFGLPQQDVNQGLDDLKLALDFNPKHLSWYQLTIEPNTVFYRNTPQLPDENVIEELYQAGNLLLSKHSFKHYEISAYATSAFESRHNLNYWRFGDYLAIGAGAHGKVSMSQNGKTRQMRFQKSRLPKDYLARLGKSYLVKQELISDDDLALEYFMNTFRLNEQTSFKHFEQVTGLPKHILDSFLHKASKAGLINFNEAYVWKTDSGERFLDTLLSYI